tara:strand:- start:29349 stop:29789 length:441 start_codon:yes stop_codon:yes gene_type:complete
MKEIIENIQSKNNVILYLYNQNKYNKEYFYYFLVFPFFLISFYLSTLNNIESFLYLISTMIFFYIICLPFKEFLRVKKINEEINQEEKKYGNDIKTIVYTTNWVLFTIEEKSSFIYHILDNEYSEKEILTEYILNFKNKSDIFYKN